MREPPLAQLKSVMDPSVRRITHAQAWTTQRDLDRPSYTVWSAGLSRRAVFPVPNGRRSGLSGAELTTYRTKGFLWEHENLEPSAGNETPRKPPSPALSRSRGGAFVVVGARESRAHGEGRQ